jgi:hypothetical protein
MLKMRFDAAQGKRMFNKRLTGRRVRLEAPARTICAGKTGTKKEPRMRGSQEFNREASNEVAPATR